MRTVLICVMCFLLGAGRMYAGTMDANEWIPIDLGFKLTDGGGDDDDGKGDDQDDDGGIDIDDEGPFGDTLGSRSLSQPVSAYQQGSVVMVMFDVPVSGATVTIYNEAADVAIRTESMTGPGQLELDLSGEDLGEYRLRIAIGENVWEGCFSL